MFVTQTVGRPPVQRGGARGAACILHADLDAFYASVEQRDDPALRGRPVIVGRGVVLAASYEARAMGVRTAMGGRQARQLCPEAVVVGPRMRAYADASRAVFEVFRRTTPVVEGISIDEAFLDVSGLRRLAGDPVQIAARLRAEVRDALDLPITVGVARTKFLAKVASRVAKPDGLLLVPPAGETAFLHPLPVEHLWGVGAASAARLRARGILTVGDLAAVPEAALARLLGRAAGLRLHALAHHRDPRVVTVGHRRRSVGAQRAVGWSAPAEEGRVALLGLVDRVTRRLRAAGRVGRTVVVRLRFADLACVSRSHTLAHATSDTHTVLAAAQELFERASRESGGRAVTLVGVAVSGLRDASAVQLELELSARSRGALDRVLDDVNRRFGTSSVTRGVLLRRGEGAAVPVPDELLDEQVDQTAGDATEPAGSAAGSEA